jgi:hypothetical protein
MNVVFNTINAKGDSAETTNDSSDVIAESWLVFQLD